MTRITGIATAALLTLFAGTTAANADACSGRSHTRGTALGAVGGGVIGGLASGGHAGGIVGGAVVGGLAGNAVARSRDCRNQETRGHFVHNGQHFSNRRWDRRDGRFHYW
jgi:hypothetical protein